MSIANEGHLPVDPARPRAYREGGTRFARVSIELQIESTSNLHIGDGGSALRYGIEHKERSDSGNKNQADEVRTLATDSEGRPYLPGSALKGALLSWVGRHRSDLGQWILEQTWPDEAPGDVLDGALDDLFGLGSLRGAGSNGTSDANSLAAMEDQGFGGRVRFEDARWIDPESPLRPIDHDEIWDPESQTTVETRVSLSRATRTSLEHHLWNCEVVPPGARFQLALFAEDISEVELRLLLGALGGLDRFPTGPIDPVALGSGSAEGWGRFQWCGNSLSVHVMTHADLRRTWIASLEESATPPAVLDSVWIRASGTPWTPPAWTPPSPDSGLLEIDLELGFDGAFASIDPHRRPPKSSEPQASESTNTLLPRVDSEGRVHLTASSFRGALRSRAERIVSGWLGKELSLESAIESVEEGLAEGGLSIVGRLFGAPGWRTPIELSNFCPTRDNAANPDVDATPQESFRQTFVALDRFVGSYAHGALFAAEGSVGGRLRGRLRLHLGALAAMAPRTRHEDDHLPWGWAVPLLALVLRDLREGDIDFGWGASRGWGACRARVLDLRFLPGSAPMTESTALDDLVAEVTTWLREPEGPAPGPLGEWCQDLRAALDLHSKPALAHETAGTTHE